MNGDWSKKIIKTEYPKIVDLYKNGLTQLEIANQYKVTPSAICFILRGLGIKGRSNRGCRDYNVDRRYFSEIDSHNKAQILGFISADGNIMRSCLRIELQERDTYYLEHIKTELQYNGPMDFSTKECKGNGIWRKYSRFRVTSQDIVDDLDKLGVIPKKSLVLQFPTETQVNKKFLSSFVCGYFEGDGCVSINRQAHTSSINICGTYIFLSKLQSILKNDLDINSTINQQKNCKIHCLWIYGNHQILKFLDWIYSKIDFVMKRKYDLYKAIQTWYTKNGDNYIKIRKKHVFKNKDKV